MVAAEVLMAGAQGVHLSCYGEHLAAAVTIQHALAETCDSRQRVALVLRLEDLAYVLRPVTGGLPAAPVADVGDWLTTVLSTDLGPGPERLRVEAALARHEAWRSLAATGRLACSPLE